MPGLQCLLPPLLRAASAVLSRALPAHTSFPPLPSPPALPLCPVMNWVGSLVAMLGTGLYSLAKQKASDNAKKAKAAAAPPPPAAA